MGVGARRLEGAGWERMLVHVLSGLTLLTFIATDICVNRKIRRLERNVGEYAKGRV